jgi:16S rRNA C1402 (ribose-2'-O) methylase RsmI
MSGRGREDAARISDGGCCWVRDPGLRMAEMQRHNYWVRSNPVPTYIVDR